MAVFLLYNLFIALTSTPAQISQSPALCAGVAAGLSLLTACDTLLQYSDISSLGVDRMSHQFNTAWKYIG